MIEPRYLIEVETSGAFVSGRFRRLGKWLHPIAKSVSLGAQMKRPQHRGRLGYLSQYRPFSRGLFA
jgi:hypothetical protein